MTRPPRRGEATPGSTAAARSGTAVPTILRPTSRTGAPAIRIQANGDERMPGDNLYSDSVVALDADTGKLKWYYQFTPGDEYDWDSTQIPVLVDIDWKGKPRKVMLWGNRNGFFYVLDRVTGEYLLGKPFIKQTWAVGIDENGRPIKVAKVLADADGWNRSLCLVRKAARTGIRRLTAREPASSICPSGTTTKQLSR